jgi:hypothetical protein
MRALFVIGMVVGFIAIFPTHIQSYTPFPKVQKVGTCTTKCSPDGNGGSRCITSCCQNCF